MDKNVIAVYAIQRSIDGYFFNKGKWVKSFDKAKIYPRLGLARAAITYHFGRFCYEDRVPELKIIAYSLTEHQVIYNAQSRAQRKIRDLRE